MISNVSKSARDSITVTRTRRIVAIVLGALTTPLAHSFDGLDTLLSNASTDSAYDATAQLISLTTKYSDDSKFSLATAYVEHIPDPLAPPDGGHLDEAFWGVQAKTDVGGAVGHIASEVGYGGFSAANGDGFGNADHRFVRIQTSQHSSLFRYGANFQSAGAQFYRPGSDIAADRASAEVWLTKSWNKLRVRSYFNQAYDNVDRDPTRARMVDSQLGARAEYTIQTWPFLGYAIEHAIGLRHSTFEPIGSDHVDATLESTRVSMKFRSTRWTSTLSTSYFNQQGDADTSSNNARQSKQQLSGTLRVSENFSLQPGIARYGSESDVETEHIWINSRHQLPWKRAQASSYLSRWNTDGEGTASQERRHGIDLTARWHSSALATRSDFYVRVAYDHQWQSSSNLNAHTEDVALWLGWHTPLAGFSPLSERASQSIGASSN